MNKINQQFIAAILSVLLILTTITGTVPKAYAAETHEVTHYDTRFDNGPLRVGYFEIDNGKVAMCVCHELDIPAVGNMMSVKAVYTAENKAHELFRKIYYYGWQGPGDIGATYVETSLAGSVANGHDDNYYGYGQAFINRISSLPPAPSGFNVTIISNGGEKQDLGFWEYHPNGRVEIIKVSENTSMTSGNACYSLEGAVFDIINDKGQVAATVTTDAKGYACAENIPQGDYTVVEKIPPKGYALNTAPLAVKLDGESVDITIEDMPKSVPISVLLSKMDSETNTNEPQGMASLAGAEFTLKYYNVQMDTDPAEEGMIPEKTWIVRTDQDGFSYLNSDYLITGSAFYLNSTGTPVLPFGTLTIQETKAPEGYCLNGEVFVQKIIDDGGNAEAVMTYNQATISETVIRRDIKVKKSSTDEIITGDNDYYSLKGAVYGLFKQTDDKKIAEITLDGNGEGTFMNIVYDNYYIQEVAAPQGYEHNSTKYLVDITDFNEKMTSIFREVSDQPQYGQITLSKIDAQSGASIAQGNASLEGAVYRITDASGSVVDTLVTDSGGKAVSKQVPLGKYYVQETAASNGYLIDSTIHTVDLVSTDGVTMIFVSNVISQEQVKRGDLELLKVSDGDMLRLAGVPFLITSKTTGENHIIVTDINGYASTASSWNPHSQNTNYGTADEDGVWFGLGAVDDALGALPYDTYIIEELACEANDGYLLIPAFEVTVYRHNQTIDLGTLTNDYIPPIVLLSNAMAEDTGTHMAHAIESTTIIDTITYTGLTPGEEYTLSGLLMDRESGEPLFITGQMVRGRTTFVAGSAEGQVDVQFNFNADGLSGKSIVVFESLYYQGQEIAAHADIEAGGQTITFATPEISTQAVAGNTDAHETFAMDTISILDRVDFSGLIAGKEYVVTGILMDKESGEPLLINGQIVTADASFLAESANGQIGVEFVFDASTLAGKTVVVFESLYYQEQEIAIHANLEDEAQTIKFKNPGIRTTAIAKDTQMAKTYATGQTTIVDVVSYRDLVVGKSYTIRGLVMCRETGEPLLIEGQTVIADAEFTASSSTGQIEVEFVFDVNGLAGRTIVIFESLYYQGQEIVVHADITDDAQTIAITKPEIKTSAIADNTRMSSTYAIDPVTIIDTISYDHLIPGIAYLIKGVLMNKKNSEPLLINGQKVTAETVFIPESESGHVEVNFTFDAGDLVGKSVVVYESLYYGRSEIAVHADIEDEGQTITFEKPEIGTKALIKETGSSEAYAVGIVTIVDTISYTGLIVGKEYLIKGVLMDKGSKEELLIAEKRVTAELIFTAEQSEGTIELEYEIDASTLAGKTVVVFESLCFQDKEISIHADINDTDQSVKFNAAPESVISNKAVKTGDDMNLTMVIAACLMSLAVIGGVTGHYIMKRKQRNN